MTQGSVLSSDQGFSDFYQGQRILKVLNSQARAAFHIDEGPRAVAQRAELGSSFDLAFAGHWGLTDLELSPFPSEQSATINPFVSEIRRVLQSSELQAQVKSKTRELLAVEDFEFEVALCEWWEEYWCEWTSESEHLTVSINAVMDELFSYAESETSPLEGRRAGRLLAEVLYKTYFEGASEVTFLNLPYASDKLGALLLSISFVSTKYTANYKWGLLDGIDKWGIHDSLQWLLSKLNEFGFAVDDALEQALLRGKENYANQDAPVWLSQVYNFSVQGHFESASDILWDGLEDLLYIKEDLRQVNELLSFVDLDLLSLDLRLLLLSLTHEHREDLPSRADVYDSVKGYVMEHHREDSAGLLAGLE